MQARLQPRVIQPRPTPRTAPLTTGMTHNTESEFKLRAQQPIEIATIDSTLQELGQKCRLADARRHTDTYLDDERGSLLRQGIGLRVRAGGGKRQLTCKTRRKDDGRLFVRDEIEAPWPTEELPASVHDLPDDLREAIQPFVGERALMPQQVLNVHREIRMLTDGDKDLCELAIDFVEATANDRTATFQEIELEVCNNLEANERLAKQLQERLPVDFAQQDKPSHAAALLGIQDPIDATAEELALRPISSVIPEQLQQILVANVELEHAVRDVGHRATVHEMQVGLERMATMIRAFDDLWQQPVHERMCTHLHTTHRQLGAVRSFHVLLDNMRNQVGSLPMQLHEAGNETVLWAEGQRDVAMDRLSEWLGDERRKATCAEFAQDITAMSADAESAQKPLLHEAPTRLAAAVKELRERLAATDKALRPEDAAAIREPLRQVRHLAAQFASVPGMSFKKSLKAVARALRHVDNACELEATTTTMLQWVATPSADLTSHSWRAAALGGLATLHSTAADEARMVAKEALERLDKEQVWRRFPTA